MGGKEKKKGTAKPSTSTQDAALKKKERLEKLRQLRQRKNEASVVNKKEVVEEDRRKSLPDNWERRQKKAEWILKEEEAKKEAEGKGLDYGRLKSLQKTILDVEVDEFKAEKKRNNRDKYTDWASKGKLKYQRDVATNIKPDINEYADNIRKYGDDVYTDHNVVSYGTYKDSQAAIDRLAVDVANQQEKRAKFSRFKAEDPEADIDYINIRNKRFNERLQRVYGDHLADIKDSLERGTAL